MNDIISKNSKDIVFLKKLLLAWDLSSDSDAKNSIESSSKCNEEWENLFDRMSEKISHLMSSSPEKFYQALYRLDVSEEKVSEILSGRLLSSSSGGQRMSKSRALAQLIVDREIQKAKTRGDLPS
jgi:hypothetical protein